MTLAEASATSGFSTITLSRKARAGAFIASKPRGNRGGWEISDTSFVNWMKQNRVQRGNKTVQALAKKGIPITF